MHANEVQTLHKIQARCAGRLLSRAEDIVHLHPEVKCMPRNFAICWKNRPDILGVRTKQGNTPRTVSYSDTNHIVKTSFCSGQSAGNPWLHLLVSRCSGALLLEDARLRSRRGISSTEGCLLRARRSDKCEFVWQFTLMQRFRRGSSETGRKKLTCHRPLPRLPQNDSDFGSFLAGLIDSDGHFSKIPQLVISFRANDFHLAYFVKYRIAYGQVRQVKHKQALVYVCAHSTGLERIAKLIHNELRGDMKIQQYNERLLPSFKRFKSRYRDTQTLTPSCAPTNSVLLSYWLAGFIAGDGWFQCKMIVRPQRTEVRLVLQIEQNTDSLLTLICNELGGYIGYRQSQATYYYSTVSFANAAKLIDYLDHTHLIGVKMTQYVLWRRACLLVQQRKPIILIKRLISRCNAILSR